MAGMVSGLAITLYYMVQNEPWLRSLFGVTHPPVLWFGISPIAAGVFGMAVGAAMIVVVSLLTAAPGVESGRFARQLRVPRAD